MGHNISAIIVKGTCDKRVADQLDLIGIPLGFDLTLFHIDCHYSEYWQDRLKTQGVLKVNARSPVPFPRESVIGTLVSKLTHHKTCQYAIIATDYFGGIGSQFANAYLGHEVIDKEVTTINQALQVLGVIPTDSRVDEFDTVGLGKYRSAPDHLDKYGDLTEELGL